MWERPYTQYVKIEADLELLAELDEALQYIWEKDSNLLIDAAIHNGGKITIIYNKELKETNITDSDRKIVPISPELKKQYYITESGEWHSLSLTRVIAHELTHTLQPKFTQEQKQENFNYRFNAILSGMVRDNNLAHTRYFLDLLEAYDALKDTTSENLAEQLKELYKNPKVRESWKEYILDMIDGYEALHTTGYTEFVTQVEKPAIERANAIMDGVEPPRNLEYKEGTHPFTALRDKLDILLTEEHFVEFGKKGLTCKNQYLI